MTTLEPPTVDRAPMRFNVDAWDPGYGTSMEVDDLGTSKVAVRVDIETPEGEWTPVDPVSNLEQPEAVLFVDGVRRIDARVWIDDPGTAATSATLGICASYGAGVVCCRAGQAHVVGSQIRRGLFTIAPHADDIRTRAGEYRVSQAVVAKDKALSVVLSAALQERLTATEIEVAQTARTLADPVPHGRDLLVVDGPLRGRAHLERTVGFVKSHQASYLPDELNAMVGRLGNGQRTPVFLIGTSWTRHSWYLRLPAAPGHPWSGIVRLEAASHLARSAVIELANLTQSTVGRFASQAYKDARAPQNLYPIAGLERDLRHGLGDQQFIYRALREAAGR